MTDPSRHVHAHAPCLISGAILAACLLPAPGSVQAGSLSAVVSCTRFMAPQKTVNGDKIGQEDCRMREVMVRDDTWPEVAEILGTVIRSHL